MVGRILPKKHKIKDFQGFSLPTATTMGVIMLSGTIIAITVAAKNKINIIAEEKTPTLSTLRNAVGLTQNGNINGAEISIGGAIIPPIENLQELNFLPVNLGNITKELTLPRLEDNSNFLQDGDKKTYYYQVENINKGSL